ncbi:MAG: carbohydrate esterase family 12 protein [Lachnospiraceae bacterium]|jgi:lysophospholipase L1-like esterase|nr:carbohydrate esterase family 12 protein [Lachnospiraceae bacterium]
MKIILKSIKLLSLVSLCAASLTLFSLPACASSDSAGTDETAAAAAQDDSSASSQNISSPSSETRLPTLWVIGDSTAAEFNDTTYYYPRYGWGTQLYRYFPELSIQNLAVSGTSTQSFLQTDNYQRLLENMQAGDYVLIGFGHNDEKPESLRYSNPNASISTAGSIQNYLFEYYIRPMQEAEVNPILCTPIVRRDPGNNYTGASGHITSPQTTIEGTFEGGDYAKAINRAGVAKSVPVLDLTKRTREIYSRLGAQGVKDRHARSSFRDASIDNTHTSLYGAACNAWLIADELSKTTSPLKNHLAEDLTPPDPSILTVNPLYTEHPFNRPDGESIQWASIGEWKGTIFGDIDGYEYLNNVYFNLSPYEDGIWMKAGRFEGNDSSIVGARVGKIATTTDGIAMYYQAVPADRNFTLSADVTIHHFDPNNQASFGLMVRDDIYLDTVTSDTLGDYVAAGPLMSGSDEPWNCFARKSGVLTQGQTATKLYAPGDTLHLEIRKTSDGYACTFGDNVPVSAGFDFPLTAIDSEYVYAGMFVARSADVTFYNVNLELE